VKFTFHIAALFLVLLFPAISTASVEGFVKDELTAMLPWPPLAIEVDEVEVPGLVFGKGASFALDMPKRPTGPGKLSYKLVVMEKDGTGRAFWGSARVRVFKQAVVALKPLKPKAKIMPEDLTLSRVELSEATEGFSTVEELEDMVARRPISAGSVIKAEYVKKETIVKRGEKVAVTVEGPSIRIRSHGVAREDGHAGAVITVRTASGKELAGEVTGPGEIVMGF